MAQDIENFKHATTEINENFDAVKKKQAFHDDEIRTILGEIEKANERIIQAKEINIQAIRTNSSHIDAQIK